MMRFRRARSVALLIVVAGVLAALLAYRYRDRMNRELAQARLRTLADRAAAQLSSKLKPYDYGLRGARGAVIAAGGEAVTRERFAAYARSRSLATEFPGAVGYGFIRRVARADADAFADAARADGWPNFSIRMLEPHARDHFVIQYVEPVEQNGPALGLDVASEPNRLDAALRSMRTGRTAMTKAIDLVQLPEGMRTGFLLFLPVYRGGALPTSDAAREAETFGWAYGAVGLHGVLESFDFADGEFTMALTDETERAQPVRMFVSPGHRHEQGLRTEREVAVFGNRWRVQIASGPRFVPSLRLLSPTGSAAEVFGVALLLAGVAYLAISRADDARRASVQLQRELEERVAIRTDELRTANERLQVVALQLQTAQRVASVGSWEFEVATRKVRWSPELSRMFGLDADERTVSYDERSPLFTPNSWSEFTAALVRSMETGESYELVLDVIRTDGEQRKMVARGEALPSAEGKVERLVGTFQDITSRERTAAQLVLVSERLKLATSAAKIGIWDWDPISGESTWDETMQAMFGRAPPNSRDRAAIRAMFPPEDAKLFVGVMRDALTARGVCQATYRIIRPNGEIRYMHGEGTVQRDANGRPTRVVGVNWDVTDKQVMELALRSAEAVQRAILAHAGTAIIATACDGSITTFNRAAEELLGYTAAELIGEATLARLHDPEEQAARTQALERELGAPLNETFELFVRKCREGRADIGEWTFVRKDGARVPVLLTMTALRDDAGMIFGFLALAVDLTVRKQHERDLVNLNALLAQRSEQAEAASRAKGMFLANMSHEIRTPIGAITGITYLLSRTQLSPEQRELLDTAERSTKNLLNMVNDVLDLSKIEAQQLALEPEPFGLGELMDDVSTFMSAYATGKQLELVVDTGEVDVAQVLVGDRVRLMQVLTNLVGNAIKYTDQGTVRLVVRSEASSEQEAQLCFAVHDTGPGIETQFLPRLFTTFTQVEQRGQRRREGTGLGLAIVKQLVTLMGGKVFVDSTVGVGSCFWCTIPFERAAPDAHRSHDAAELSLLIVDDHDAQRMALAGCARQLGWEVQMAASGEAALSMVLERAAQSAPFDVVVLDCKLPGLDGSETLARMRERLTSAQLAELSVVITTSDDLADLESHSTRRAETLLPKPVTTSSLFDAVLQAMAKRGPGHAQRRVVPPRAAGQRLPGVAVLVADDSAINRDVARRILELEGAKVLLASDGSEAVNIVLTHAHELDLVLMDVQMPGDDGVAATVRIRADARFASLPIIALTAGALASERERAIQAGMDDFVTKPYDPEMLIARVREYVSRVRGEPLRITTNTRTALRRADWPAVDGIESEDAYARLGGDVGLFRQLLGRLLAELEHAQTPEAVSLAPERHTELTTWLHKLRGMAGNLGVRELAAAAESLERSLRGNDRSRVEEARHRLWIELERVRASIADLLSTAPPTRTVADNSNASLDDATVDKLLTQLREQDLDALTLFALIAPLLDERLGQTRTAELHTALQQLDFPAAASIVSALRHTGS
jgi:PAS domain S-box-containing protein